MLRGYRPSILVTPLSHILQYLGQNCCADALSLHMLLPASSHWQLIPSMSLHGKAVVVDISEDRT